jgi:FKBP-type peptidyl-prolyl cis-trans isomerase
MSPFFIVSLSFLLYSSSIVPNGTALRMMLSPPKRAVKPLTTTTTTTTTTRREALATATASLNTALTAVTAVANPSSSGAVPDDGLTFVEAPSGLKYADVRLGKGDAMVGPDSRVTVDLVGRLVGRQGWKFENTRDDGEPYRLQLGRGAVVAGLEEGLQGMQVGGYRRLVLPSRLAYSVPDGRSLEPIPRSFDFQQRLYSTVLNPTRAEQEQLGLKGGEDVTGIVQLDVVVLLIRPPAPTAAAAAPGA